MNIEALVKINPRGHELGGSSRHGTAHGTMYDLEAAIGRPHAEGDQCKVTVEWFFETPRGRAALRDYHWNAEGEWSLASTDPRAVMWLAAYLRSLGIKAIGRRRYD